MARGATAAGMPLGRSIGLTLMALGPLHMDATFKSKTNKAFPIQYNHWCTMYNSTDLPELHLCECHSCLMPGVPSTHFETCMGNTL